ncbi:hypothetical protein KV205_26730 [Streptomyces sp. SKN60]|uniref:hypothetical protein n=1 Tax=Streptomyces sp. SKN60 TaxID=2855506 RepID=UPI002246B033|nr:hypothetical protein [Streptomyces sp. SKN60]MCX2184099.1 hypothetical protein [Streptomyces sp. SKN60]
MPRKRPGALRAQITRPRRMYGSIGAPPQIDRLSGRTVSAIHAEESRRPRDEGLGLGDTRIALKCLRTFLARPGSPLYPRRTVCGCDDCERGENVAVARDLLALVLSRLPPHRARRELAALVAELDEELRRRTLPDPFAYRQTWRGGGWWHGLIYDETCHL